MYWTHCLSLNQPKEVSFTRTLGMNHPPQTEAKWPEEEQGPQHAGGSSQQKTRLTFGGGLASQDAVSARIFFYVKKVGRQWREEQSRSTQKTGSKRIRSGGVFSTIFRFGTGTGAGQLPQEAAVRACECHFPDTTTPPVIALGALAIVSAVVCTVGHHRDIHAELPPLWFLVPTHLAHSRSTD